MDLGFRDIGLGGRTARCILKGYGEGTPPTIQTCTLDSSKKP